jgi:hypothetical protein
VHLAAVRLAAGSGDPAAIALEERRFAFERASVRVFVEPEADKLDLNAAGPGDLSRLAMARGVPADEAEALSDRLLDYRDGDDLVRLNGAENRAYREAGRVFGTREAPFERVEEAAGTLGLGAELFSQLRPFLTVHSGRAGAIVPSVAGGSSRVGGARRNWSGTAPPSVVQSGAGMAIGAPAFRVEAIGESGGAVRRVDSVIRLTGDERVFVALTWQTGAPLGGASGADNGR